MMAEEQSDDDSGSSRMLDVDNVLVYAYLAVRFAIPILVVWFASGVSRNPRFFSGILSAVFSGFLVYTYLEPLFVPVNLEIAMIFFHVLVSLGGLVGLALGVLLPVIFPGICFGGSLALLAGSFGAVFGFSPLFFPVVGGVLAILSAILSSCWSVMVISMLAAAIEGGAVATCVVYKPMLPFIMDITRGYQYYPLEGENPTVFQRLVVIRSLCWLGSAVLVVFVSVCRHLLSRCRNRETETPSSDQEISPNSRARVHREETEPEAYSVNRDSLPPRPAEFANLVNSASVNVGSFFGFQGASVRNQAEHLMILLSNNCRRILPDQPPSPIDSLHEKVFSNCEKWCCAMGVEPHFSTMDASVNSPLDQVTDLVIFFCIWGEGSNLRHMPECLCFLYHKMMEEYRNVRSEGLTTRLYAGSFLDTVVTPIYDIIAAESKKENVDHQDMRNYDDFNEFFWSRNCLRYRYSSVGHEGGEPIQGSLLDDSPPSIAEGLAESSKTFLEKRSWLRVVLTMNRILEWHIVTFYVLGVVAFARELVWGWVDFLQVASAVFWIFNALALCWALLEVWASYPNIQLSRMDMCRSVFILVARFLTLAHQTLYLMFAFSRQQGVYLHIKGYSSFWWWQYIWISFLVMIPYIVQTFLQLVPCLVTRILNSQNACIRSFLNFVCPLSGLYVGKEVHESFCHTIVYVFFWATLVALKLFMSYVFEIYPMVVNMLYLTAMPTFFLYLIDMGLWYAVWQALAGVYVGLSDHLGKIRTIEDIRMNFKDAAEQFCKKMVPPETGSLQGSGNQMPDDSSLLVAEPGELQGSDSSLLDLPIRKWVAFSAAWNGIIDHFREEDTISNAERDILKFSRFDGSIYLPVFLTAGIIDDVLCELERPVEEYQNAQSGAVTDNPFFEPIYEHNIMQVAVAELWELASYLFLQILGDVHSNDIHAVLNMVDHWMESGTMTENMKLESTRSVIKPFGDVLMLLEEGVESGALANTRMIKPIQNKLLRLIDVVTDSIKSRENDFGSRDVFDRLKNFTREGGFFWDDEYASAQLDQAFRNLTFRAVLKKLRGLVCLHPSDAQPKSKEVKGRLTFFINSFFMDMPDAPSIRDMFSWSVLTPFYSDSEDCSEAVAFSESDLIRGSMMHYLQTLHRPDWNNFLERLHIRRDDDEIWSEEFVHETRRWASMRGQTLSRTVHGMMSCEKALGLFANLERLHEDTTDNLMVEKFSYVLSCQAYGKMKQDRDPQADDIDALLHRFPSLRVAYIDSDPADASEASVYYSVLIKSDGEGIVKVYQVRLPGNPIVGEGKPENQNHAIVFTRGEFVQTIDTDQECYFEEALKTRNCLQEFATREGSFPTTILGLRENVCISSVSSLTNYMALQQMLFVTRQRVLARPLRIRCHCGPPDILDKLFFFSRGGISKASKCINQSADIFAGYNSVIRGGSVGSIEYLQFAKGRDVGINQISSFEARLSQGVAEQSLSRDVYRLCARLDFCRVMSFYYGGIGHYYSYVLAILADYIVVYAMLLLALYDIEKIKDRIITPMEDLQIVLVAPLLADLGVDIGLFTALCVERGVLWSIKEAVLFFITTGAPLYCIFHVQTKAVYMAQTILVGGTKHPTGDGFISQHMPFDEQYRSFGSTHLYLGIELAAGLILVGIISDMGKYAFRTWSLWLVSASLLWSPFWFNPHTLHWHVLMSDYQLWLEWIKGSRGGAAKSWSMWWDEEKVFYKNLTLISKGPYLVKAALFFLVARGIDRSTSLNEDNAFILPVIFVALVVFKGLFQEIEGRMPRPIRRTIGSILFWGLLVVTILAFPADKNYILYCLACYYRVGAVCFVGLLLGCTKLVKGFYHIHDIVCAHIIFIPLFILAALQLPGMIQDWLLNHDSLPVTNVFPAENLRYSQNGQETDGDEEDIGYLEEQAIELQPLRR